MYQPPVLRRFSTQEITDSNMDEVARSLYQCMLFSYPELVIKKYDRAQESDLVQLFRRTEELTRDEKRPVVYLEIDTGMVALEKDNLPEFYRRVVGRVLNSLSQTRYAGTDSVTAIQEAFDNDFEMLYGESGALLRRGGYSFGANLAKLFYSCSEDKKNDPIPLINISNVPNLSKNSVSTTSSEGLISQSDMNLERAVTFPSSALFDFFLGGGGHHKAIAIPGWTIDIIRGDQPDWYKSIQAIWQVHDELQFRQVIDL